MVREKEILDLLAKGYLYKEIAAELGTAREVVSRLLKHFEAQGLVRLERRQILVTDMAQLSQLHVQ